MFVCALWLCFVKAVNPGFLLRFDNVLKVSVMSGNASLDTYVITSNIIVVAPSVFYC